MGDFLPDSVDLGYQDADVAGEFGDPGPLADLAVRLDGRCPGPCRDLQHALVNRLGDHHVDRVGQQPSPLGERGDEVVGCRLRSRCGSGFGVRAGTSSAAGAGPVGWR